MSQPLADDAKVREKIVMHLITSMPGMSMEYRSYAEEATDLIMQLFTRYSTARTLAVIGEDDKNNDFPASNFYKHTVGRNQLRAEQRQLLEQEGKTE